jgi:hypothetical protein
MLCRQATHAWFSWALPISDLFKITGHRPHMASISAKRPKIPKRILNETKEILIEKQAILEVLLDSRIWGDKYIINPFPYLERDVTKIPAEDLKHFKKTFYINLRKYQAFRDKVCSLEAYIPILELNCKFEALSERISLPRV